MRNLSTATASAPPPLAVFFYFFAPKVGETVGI